VYHLAKLLKEICMRKMNVMGINDSTVSGSNNSQANVRKADVEEAF
jgi:hypothetical protein